MVGGHQGYETNRGARRSRDERCVPPLLRNFPQERHDLGCVTQISVGIGVDLFIYLVTQIFRSFFVPIKPDRREVVDLGDPNFVVPVQVHSSVGITEQGDRWAFHLEVNSLKTSSTISHPSRPSSMLSKASCFNRGMSY